MPLFFFSSRRRHTRSYGDWSSDVCSSDLMLVTSEIVRTQGDVEQGRLVTSIATVQYLAWAIPAIGFLGTVRGLAGGLSKIGRASCRERGGGWWGGGGVEIKRSARQG